jgi:flagellar biosynthesis protein FliP
MGNIAVSAIPTGKALHKHSSHAEEKNKISNKQPMNKQQKYVRKFIFYRY